MDTFDGIDMVAIVAPNNTDIIDTVKATNKNYNLDTIFQQYKDGHFWFADYSGFSEASISNSLPYIVYPLNPYQNNVTGYGIADGDTIQIHQSPHTKEELQAAGLWPWSN